MLPNRYIAFDTETVAKPVGESSDSVLHTLRLGVAIYTERTNRNTAVVAKCVFTNRDEFWRFVYSSTNPTRPLYVVAHSLGFDLQIVEFFREIDDGNLAFSKPRKRHGSVGESESPTTSGESLICFDDPPTIIRAYTKDGHAIYFVDTLNWIRVSLKVVGDSIGTHKLPMPNDDAPHDQWLRYCERDAEIVAALFDRIVSLHRQFGIHALCYTTPSLAYTKFCQSWQSMQIERHGIGEVSKMERDAHYGGDVHCFYVGRVCDYELCMDDQIAVDRQMRLVLERGSLHIVDCVGMYAYIMRNFPLPYKLADYTIRENFERGVAIEHPENCVATVFLDAATRSFPARRDGFRVNETGRFATTLCGHELAAAFSSGSVVAVSSVARYETGYLFGDFIDAMMRERAAGELAGNKLRAMLAKLCANGLYGKFAQKTTEWIDAHNIPPECEWGQWIAYNVDTQSASVYRSLGGFVQMKVDKGEHPKSFCAIAAFVTSAAREYMRAVIDIAGRDNVYHQCVDSLIVNDRGLHKLIDADLIDEKKLGGFRIEYSAKQAVFRGANDYTIGELDVHSGVKYNAKQIAPGVWRQPVFVRLNAAAQAGGFGGVLVCEREIARSYFAKRAPEVNYGWRNTDEIDSITYTGEPFAIGPDAIESAAAASRSSSDCSESAK